ncbi:hypothetical protein [Metabacillus fastidiosus]|uniref:hypothetical protein n=1 Tax=Metabacillus fastidiosus TaxID=1458 RepID=UPI002E21111E|nr:hypothetical protein [Metabacillus fastidiosus]
MFKGIEERELDKHLPNIVFSEKLKNLTAEQIESVAFLMERSYHKGKEEANNKPYKGLKDGGITHSITINPTIHITKETSAEQIKQVVTNLMNESIDRSFT